MQSEAARGARREEEVRRQAGRRMDNYHLTRSVAMPMKGDVVETAARLRVTKESL
jgi:hypothetical protein